MWRVAQSRLPNQPDTCCRAADGGGLERDVLDAVKVALKLSEFRLEIHFRLYRKWIPIRPYKDEGRITGCRTCASYAVKGIKPRVVVLHELGGIAHQVWWG